MGQRAPLVLLKLAAAEHGTIGRNLGLYTALGYIFRP